MTIKLDGDYEEEDDADSCKNNISNKNKVAQAGDSMTIIDGVNDGYGDDYMEDKYWRC